MFLKYTQIFRINIFSVIIAKQFILNNIMFNEI